MRKHSTELNVVPYAEYTEEPSLQNFQLGLKAKLSTAVDAFQSFFEKSPPPSPSESLTGTRYMVDFNAIPDEPPPFELLPFIKDEIFPFLKEFGVYLIPTALVAFIVLSVLSNPPKERTEPELYKRGEYDPDVAKAFFSSQPFLVLGRLLQLLRISNGFLLSILKDNITKKEEERRVQRAAELVSLIPKAGSTAMKIGQAVSVRPDLIPYEYTIALSALMDRRSPPAFDASTARDILREELLRGEKEGRSLSAIFADVSSLDDRPEASTSIAQIYRASLRDNTPVALKIQRPDVLEEIALDLHIAREYLAPMLQNLVDSKTSYRKLIDVWGREFIAELDYNQELPKIRQFQEEVAERGLQEVVTGPVVLAEYCTEKVLVTEWVDGKRLDETGKDAEEVTRLCSVALNAYLIMLLENGTVKCDYNPSNLLRASDGKLCILDFAKTCEIDPNLQYDMLEVIANSVTRDYDKIPQDLVTLGILKESFLDEVKEKGYLQDLVDILQLLAEGSSEVEEDSIISSITVELLELQRRHPDAFRVPPWVLYGSRAILNLEKISLQADEKFSLMQSTFPYIANRLLQDEDDRAQTVLRDLLYGSGQYASANRTSDLIDGYTKYAASKSTTPVTDAQSIVSLANEAADILLTNQGNFMQSLLLDATATAYKAAVKDTIRELLIDKPSEIRNSLPFSDRFPPSFRERYVKPLLNKSERDENAQEFIESLAAQYMKQQQGGAETQLSSLDLLQGLDPEKRALVVEELKKNLPRYTSLIRQLGDKFASKVASKILEKTRVI